MPTVVGHLYRSNGVIIPRVRAVVKIPGRFIFCFGAESLISEWGTMPTDLRHLRGLVPKVRP